jgi:hypothetical protein
VCRRRMFLVGVLAVGAAFGLVTAVEALTSTNTVTSNCHLTKINKS